MRFIPKKWERCPRCGAPTQRTIAYSGAFSEFWLECTSCNTYINTYTPQPHQQAVHQDNHRFIGNFGGYGSGKTLTSREEILKHVFLTPNANVLIGANVASQYEQTIKRELENDIPAGFVADYSAQKSYMDLINGARIMYRPFDDPDKLRSYNLTMFVMVEASEIKPDAFFQLKTRLRSMNATVPQLDGEGYPAYATDIAGRQVPLIVADWRKGIIESNPGAGWIRSEVLFHADSIRNHGQAIDVYPVPADEKDPAISAHVTSSDANKFLPPTFVADISKNRPAWWIMRFVHSSFAYAEGLVYPSADKAVIETKPIPVEWKRLCAFDYGLHDPSAFIYAAINEADNEVVIYKEDSATDHNIEQLARTFKDSTSDIPIGGWLTAPLIDPKSGPRRDYNKKTLIELFQEQGIAFQPGQVSVDARVFRLNTYFEAGKIKIMDCCTTLIKELRDYKFAEIPGSGGQRSNKPEDKNNHRINALEWIVMELPADPKRLVRGIYDKYGRDVTTQKAIQRNHLPFALQDSPWESLPDPYANDAYGIEQFQYDF